MEIILLIIICFAVIFFVYKSFKHKPLSPLMPKKYNFGKRRVTFRTTIQLLEERKAKTLVETGVAREGLKYTKSDGASTLVFGTWAKQNNTLLHSVDIDPTAIETAQKEVDQLSLQKHVQLHVQDSVEFLKTFEEQVDFLYLDSYDYSRKDTTVQRNSQEHHFKEFQAIEPHLHEKTIVLIDDCRLPGGGKGKLVIEYMQKKGWKILMNKYQVLLVKS
jgi:predicted O-methyltransferase YrrM